MALFRALARQFVTPTTIDGNTYLPDINTARPSKMRAVRGYQIFFALVYAACIALAVSGISFNMQCGEDDGPPYQSYYQFSQQSFRIYVPLGLLALGSTLHVMPEGAPFSYLLWWFRVGMIFQFGVQILSLAKRKFVSLFENTRN